MGVNRPGDLLAGRFRLAELLAESDRGRFWRADDGVLDRPVSIDVLDADDERAPRLLDAARAAATMGDPRLLRILDAALDDDIAYVVNEWGEGISLDDQVAVQGPLEPRHAAWVIAEVADTVARAHGLGLLHGRLIPENVLLDRLGAVRIIGFAVEGVLHGLPLTTPTDEVRALGALLHAALTGTWAGEQASVVPATLLEHGRPMRARQIRAGVPRALDDLCSELLALPDHPEDRPAPDADAVRDMLLEFVESGDWTSEQLELTGTRSHRRAAASQADVSTQFSLPPFGEAGAPTPTSPAPVPPPLVPRPLFADTPPPATGPRLDPGVSDGTAAPVPGRRWMRLGLVLGAVLVVIIGSAAVYGIDRVRHHNDAASSGPTTPPAQPVLISGTRATDYDPQGDHSENPDEAGAAVDTNPTTGWETSRYYQQLGPHGLKRGVGLVIDLRKAYDVDRVSVLFASMPTRASVTVTPSAPTAATADTLRASGAAPGGTTTVHGNTVVATFSKPAAGRYVIVWLTSLPRVTGGYRARVDEVHVVGTPVT